MRFCGGNGNAPLACPWQCHSPLDQALGSVTLATRDPTPPLSRHGLCPRRDPRRFRPRAIDRRRKKEAQSARGNARGRFAHAFRNARANRKTETGQAEIKNKKETEPDP